MTFTRLYDVLEVGQHASQSEIRRAYHRLAKEHHPDKGGDREKFQAIDRAYKVLGDPPKRANYDKNGEEDSDSSQDRQRRPKTKDVVHPLKCTLEQLYAGSVRKMAINRQVIDKEHGVRTCCDCDGRGVRVEGIRMGGMTQYMQSHCSSCDGQGTKFKTKKEREVVEVHVQKGAPEGQKIRLREKADEHPGADTGDVVFEVKQVEHPDFKRKGADLYIERKISLVEALCGMELEVTHLDGRKLLIKTSPGEIVRPMSQGFDPLADHESKKQWVLIENSDCPDIDNVAQTETTDVDTLKKACETQLRRQGLDVTCFCVDGQRAYFKTGSREEILAAKKPRRGCSMYVLSDPNSNSACRMMKAVKGEGMPTSKNPFVHGNLFLILTIDFPKSLDKETQDSLRTLLPPPLNVPIESADEEHTMTDIDPVQSHNCNKVNMQSSSEAYDEDEERSGQPMGSQGRQCHQM